VTDKHQAHPEINVIKSKRGWLAEKAAQAALSCSSWPFGFFLWQKTIGGQGIEKAAE